MTKILFVCYHHGCRGERLSVNISQHKNYRTLDAIQSKGRTVIKNDYFDKQFLKSWSPPFDRLKNLSGSNIVVPSHFFYDTLIKYYPDALYVAVDLPKDLTMYRQSLYDRFFQYKTQNIAELAGECENRIREYRPSATADEIREFTVEVLKKKNITFGEIRCMAKGIPATEENQITLLHNHTPESLSEQTTSNSLVIAYEDVDQVDPGYVVSYFNK
jgi:hypothetical protein